MKLLISILDFSDFTAFSRNIGAHLADPYIRQAQQYDVQLPAAVRAELEAELAVVQPDFKPGEFDAADFDTVATTAGWQNLKLARVWYEAIRPLLVLEAARRMLLWHGLHITPAAAESGTDRPITSQQRTELRADLLAQAAYYRPLFEAGLRSLLPAPAPAACGTSLRRLNRGGLRTAAI